MPKPTGGHGIKKSPTYGKIVNGPEYLTVFEGRTGKELFWIRKNIFQPVIPWMVGEVSVAIVVMIILVVVQTVLQLE